MASLGNGIVSTAGITCPICLEGFDVHVVFYNCNGNHAMHRLCTGNANNDVLVNECPLCRGGTTLSSGIAQNFYPGAGSRPDPIAIETERDVTMIDNETFYDVGEFTIGGTGTQEDPITIGDDDVTGNIASPSVRRSPRIQALVTAGHAVNYRERNN